MTIAIRAQLWAATACLVIVAVGVLCARRVPEPRVELPIDFGTSCPRPCRFPQLEADR